MSDYDKSEFDERLIELNNWQIEQQEKLKNFQDTQRRLLDSEHEKILSNLKTQNYDDRHNSKSPIFNFIHSENESETDRYKHTIPNYIFNFKPDAIKLKEPKVNLCSIKNVSHTDETDEGVKENHQDSYHHCHNETGDGGGDNDDDEEDYGDYGDYGNNGEEEIRVMKPRKFLKRGEGLARFRMTLDDFKYPPNIYREKRFKTYLRTQGPDFNRRKTKTVKSSREQWKAGKKSGSSNAKSLPVNIYVADNSKSSKSTICPVKNEKPESVKSCSKRKEIPKVPAKGLTLKPCVARDRSETVSKPTVKLLENVKALERKVTEKQIKKDEHELKMFEMLEGKIDDGSLSPNSSLVARFMEESMSSTPSKPVQSVCDNAGGYSYMESLRTLQKQYLTDEQLERLQVDDNNDEDDVAHGDGGEEEEDNDDNDDDDGDDDDDDVCSIEIKKGVTDGESVKDADNVCQVEDDMKETCVYELGFDTNKMCIPENVDEVKEEDVDEDAQNRVNEPCLSQREISIKLQRKALQDNVKGILNWDGPPRRKPVRRPAKNRKPEPKPKESDEEKIVFDSWLLQQRLDELSKEIETFKKENKNLNQLQRECNAEKLRLERERREFSKAMELEREKFEARMAEEQRKLQRDKAVFDKYCKHVKSQPNKKEREEIANLKKEVERLTETIATKDSRWGASQARLRNQIKHLEKENAELKSEIEKLRKQTAKKAVTFERGKSANARIIHAINSELGKLKPHIVAATATAGRQKSQSLSARESAAMKREKKPGIRRIKSVPDLNVSGNDERKAVLSESARIERYDSESPPSGAGDRGGNEQSTVSPRKAVNCNVSEASKTNVNKGDLINSDIINGNGSDWDFRPLEIDPDITDLRRNIRGKHLVESVLHETLFETRDRGDHNASPTSTITEIKRRLEHLNHLHNLNSDGDCNEDSDDAGGMKCRNASSEDDDTGSGKDDFDRDSMTVQRNCGGRLGQFYAECHRPKPSDNSTAGNSVREKTFDDGRREIFYPNGNIKKISPDGRIVKMIYYNGDLKETDVAEGSEKYFYAETKTWHTTYKDGLEVLEFSNGQTERRHPDGSSEILFPNGCVRYCDPFGKDEWRFVDGTVIKTDKNGHKVLLLPNGQKEIHTKEYKKREYPDGTVKLLYADGTQETRYATGRVRLKDRDGNLVMDSGGI